MSGRLLRVAALITAICELWSTEPTSELSTHPDLIDQHLQQSVAILALHLRHHVDRFVGWIVQAHVDESISLSRQLSQIEFICSCLAH